MQDGPLLETNTSQEPGGKLKCFAHTRFKFVRFNLSWSNATNSLGDTGLNIYLLSGSAASRWTISSCRAVPFLPHLPVSALARFAPIFAFSLFHKVCLLGGIVKLNRYIN